MAITKGELESFNRYVEEKMHDGGAGLSLEDCLRQWRATRKDLQAVGAEFDWETD